MAAAVKDSGGAVMSLVGIGGGIDIGGVVSKALLGSLKR